KRIEPVAQQSCVRCEECAQCLRVGCGRPGRSEVGQGPVEVSAPGQVDVEYTRGEHRRLVHAREGVDERGGCWLGQGLAPGLAVAYQEWIPRQRVALV